MIPITHTLAEAKEFLSGRRNHIALENALVRFDGTPLTFTEMSKIGVPDDVIYWLFIFSPKVSDSLKKQLADFHCWQAEVYCDEPESVRKYNSMADGYSAAWWTGAYLHVNAAARKVSRGLKSEDLDDFIAVLYENSAECICVICDSEPEGEEAA